jgi:hypothetical protein
MPVNSRTAALFLTCATLVLSMSTPSGARDGSPEVSDPGKKAVKKPNLVVKASPAIAFSPARVVLRAELRGGDDDYEDYYCAAIEWEWGDGTTSENAYDCEPYEAGKSEIRRTFATSHTYQTSGSYQIHFRLKQRNKVVAAASAPVQIRPGLREGIPGT